MRHPGAFAELKAVFPALVLFAGLAAFASGSLADTHMEEPAADSAAPRPAVSFGPDDVVRPPGLPEIGKWMIDPDGSVAHWLGATYRGRHIREPINVILVDRGAASATDASERLTAAVTAAGYPSRRGHSGGYRGHIGGSLYDQLPAEPDHAFSNRLYVFDNNHGRVFGPAQFDEGYLFIAAFSRERVAPFATVRHQYESFDRARDDLSQRLDAHSDYELVGFIDLDNAILGDAEFTTGDHDGRAVLLRIDP